MKQFDFIVQTSVGIHARPAMMLVNIACKFQSDIFRIIKIIYKFYKKHL
ncbi:hypothetical protein DWV72_04845 [Firmicutes bacterium AF12-30]|nr:hypothetical protein DWV72_04845 [Firmicutes bacterium AF12-30]